jgi:hypothetical protein
VVVATIALTAGILRSEAAVAADRIDEGEAAA